MADMANRYDEGAKFIILGRYNDNSYHVLNFYIVQTTYENELVTYNIYEGVLEKNVYYHRNELINEILENE